MSRRESAPLTLEDIAVLRLLLGRLHAHATVLGLPGSMRARAHDVDVLLDAVADRVTT